MTTCLHNSQISRTYWLLLACVASRQAQKSPKGQKENCSFVNDVIIGMPYYGCLNVFTNVIQKPFKAILNEFSGVESNDSPTGDVKYNLGANYTWPTPLRKKSITLTCCQPIP